MLLPLPLGMSIIARGIDARDDADRQHVAHRDIKPAEPMRSPQNDVVKLTDSGIARITESTTNTRMVLGTPPDLCTEELADNKIRACALSCGTVDVAV